jgi:hypothetical protein
MKQIPWLSLGLLFLAYCTFGWLLSESIPSLTASLSQRASLLALEIEEGLVSLLVYTIASIFLLLITLALTAPVTIMGIFVEGGLSSDKTAFLSAFIWAFLTVLMVIFFEYFVRLLIMIGVVVLARIELRNLGVNKLQCFLIIVGVCMVGFVSGLMVFEAWEKAIA